MPYLENIITVDGWVSKTKKIKHLNGGMVILPINFASKGNDYENCHFADVKFFESDIGYVPEAGDKIRITGRLQISKNGTYDKNVGIMVNRRFDEKHKLIPYPEEEAAQEDSSSKKDAEKIFKGKKVKAGATPSVTSKALAEDDEIPW